MLAYGRGRWAVSQKRIQIHPVPCEPSLLTASPKALLGSFSNDDDEGDSNDSAKKRNGFVKQNNNFARASRFFVHFFAVTARLRRENAWFHSLWRTQTSDDQFFFLFLNLSAVDKKSNLEKFTHIWHFQRIGINATTFEKARIPFQSDVFAAVAFVDAKASYY